MRIQGWERGIRLYAEKEPLSIEPITLSVS